jgi:mRNA interferase RelE/StbE
VPTPLRVKLPPELVTLLRGLHPHIKRKVRSALDTILRDPSSGKPLHDELAGYQSFRVGKIRIIYRQREVIEVVAIGPRETIYCETALLLKRSKPIEPGG